MMFGGIMEKILQKTTERAATLMPGGEEGSLRLWGSSMTNAKNRAENDYAKLFKQKLFSEALDRANLEATTDKREAIKMLALRYGLGDVGHRV